MDLSKFISQLQHSGHNLLKPLQHHRSILWLNGLVLLFFIVLSLYVKIQSSGQLLVLLFEAPFNRERPYTGMLTTVSNLMLCVSMAVCAFSARTMQKLPQQRQQSGFLICSALLMGLLLCDRTFRLTILLITFGPVSKTAIFILYGMLLLLYGWVFQRQLRETPCALLLAGGSLFVISALIDLAHLSGQGMPALLEEGSAMIAALNLTIYFWLTCLHQILEPLSLQTKP